MVSTSNNEKISLFSRSCIFDHGVHVINVKNEKLNNYIWWKSLLKPHENFNPEKTKGFLVLRLLLYGYLNRISTYRSNSDNTLMYPYLKILLNNKEIYRTKILNSSIHVWDEKVDIQIHYIQSKIEIQLYDLDETDGVVEDEHIGSAIINICDLKLSKKYDIVIKFLDKKGILIDPYVFKNALNEKIEKEKKGEEPNSEDEFADIKQKHIKDMGTTSFLKKAKHKNDYNIRMFAKLVNKYQFSKSILELNCITSINYKFINKSNEILENDLNVNKLYKDIKKIKLNFDTIWLPFFLIIYNFISWKKPLFSIFFFVFLCFCIVFSKLFFSFFLLSLSLVIFIFVSIIKESDDKFKSKHLLLLKKMKSKKVETSKRKQKKEKYYYSAIEATGKKQNVFQNVHKKKDEFNSNNSDLTNEITSIDSSSTISSNDATSSSSSSSSNSSDDIDDNIHIDSSTFDMLNQKKKRYKSSSSTLIRQEKSKKKNETPTKSGINDEAKDISEEETEEDEKEGEEEEEEEDEDEDEKNDEETEEEGKEDVIETDLTVIKTFISNVLDDEIICNVKYFHFLLSSLMQISQNILNIFRKFGYFLVILSWFLCILNIFFYSTVAKLLRFSFFLSGFVLFTYNFKPMNIVYRFLICSRKYYSLKMKNRKIDIFNR